MKSLSIRELRQSLSSQIAAVEAGEAIVVTRRGRPVAKITAIDTSHCRIGSRFGRYTIRPAVRGGAVERALEILEEDRGECLDKILGARGA